jgi:hypothetical protein
VSRRVFVTVERGMTDRTAVCVFPWEVPILQLVHGGAVKEVSIDELCKQEGVIKVEKLKLKHTEHPAPDLRAQYEIMAYVDPEEDPARDPDGEYERMANKYGMDKELPISCVARIYGEPTSGAFKKLLEEHRDDVAEKPTALKAADEGLGKAPNQMTVKELREALRERGIEWKVSDGKAALVEKLEANLAPA